MCVLVPLGVSQDLNDNNEVVGKMTMGKYYGYVGNCHEVEEDEKMLWLVIITVMMIIAIAQVSGFCPWNIEGGLWTEGVFV